MAEFLASDRRKPTNTYNDGDVYWESVKRTLQMK